MTIARNSASYTEQLMPFEVFSWELYASVYNLTVMIHGTSEYASDDRLNWLNQFPINLTISDVAIFIDLVVPNAPLRALTNSSWVGYKLSSSKYIA